MNTFIDVHSHLAWGIDDGMDCEEHARNTLQLSKKDGIQAIIATPHFIPGQCEQEQFEKMTNRMNALQVLGKEYGIQIYKGSEFFLNDDYLSMLDEKLFHPLADSNYVLVEFNVKKEIGTEQEVEDKFYEFIIRGYRPIIAHVERYFHNGINVERVKDWIKMGCYIQVNRTSILGLGGKMSQKNATVLLNEGLVHLIGTDTHTYEGTRVSVLSDVYEVIHKKYGEYNANLLCKENANCIIEDQELMLMEKKKKRFSFFRK